MWNMGVKRRLFSYPFIENDESIREGFEFIIKEYVSKGYELMVDSGAFSVAKRDIRIDIDKYANFLLHYKDKITVSVNLDVIVQGRKTPEALEKAAREGWENLKYLESKGLKILHTFHSGEDIKWLYRLMDGYEYFGLSRTGDVGGVEQRLDRVFSILCNGEGQCRWKVHGFGITSPQMMCRWPFYSVDSVSWAKYGIYGVIVMFKEGVFKSIGISDRKLTLWARKGQHYNNLNEMERKMWDEEMEHRGINRDMLQNNDVRNMWNLWSFLELEKWIEKNGVNYKHTIRLL